MGIEKFLFFIMIGWAASQISRKYFNVDLPDVYFYICSFLIPLFLFLTGILIKQYIGIEILPNFVEKFPDSFTTTVSTYITGMILGGLLDKLVASEKTP